ncbi:MAG: hypothetical protein ACK5IP_01430 [Paracoccus sp. (in: a-proteobacteria)]
MTLIALHSFEAEQIGGRFSGGLADPLTAVRAVTELLSAGAAAGLEFHQGTDFSKLVDFRQQARGSQVSPMFDPAVDSSLGRIGFWMTATDQAGKVVAMQSFRIDDASPNLADWVLGWMIGLYARRHELIIPRDTKSPRHSVANAIRGPVVYHGELWVDSHQRKCFDIFTRLGIFLAFIKWQPAAIWALVGDAMATRGHMVRMSYAHVEPGFLTWEWCPAGADEREWLGISENRHLQLAMQEIATTGVKRSP